MQVFLGGGADSLSVNKVELTSNELANWSMERDVSLLRCSKVSVFDDSVCD